MAAEIAEELERQLNPEVVSHPQIDEGLNWRLHSAASGSRRRAQFMKQPAEPAGIRGRQGR